MKPPSKSNRKPHILILYGNVGGGHRSAAEALSEAITLDYGNKITTTMIDVLKEYAPAPFDQVPKAYSQMIKAPAIWKQFYDLGDGPRRTKVISSSIALYARRQAEELLENHPADLIVSVYHFANAPILDLFSKRHQRIPYVTVVTDLVTAPHIWFDNRVDLCIVPTQQALERALSTGMDPKKLLVVGQPIKEAYRQPPASKTLLRQQLGWPTNRPNILIIAGGEGIGPLKKICDAIVAAKLPVSLAVVTGRNSRLKAKLEAKTWPVPFQVYGFIRFLPKLMQAADILVTKAGPGSISEAFCCGLPILLYDHLPGQEEGNVSYVTKHGAGLWVPTPDEIAAAIADWIKHPRKLSAARSNSWKLAKPNASHDIARIIAQKVNII